jgi:hypothetical protein
VSHFADPTEETEKDEHLRERLMGPVSPAECKIHSTMVFSYQGAFNHQRPRSSDFIWLFTGELAVN